MIDAFSLIEKYTAESKPLDIEPLIRELGIVLDKKADLGPEIAGQIEIIENQYKISVNKNDHYFRQRFTMAHELGHYLFHRHLIDADGITDNRLYRDTTANKIAVAHEVEANKFASSLLMPLRHIKRDYEEMNQDVNEVAKKWQVSPKAMSIRLGLPS